MARLLRTLAVTVVTAAAVAASPAVAPAQATGSHGGDRSWRVQLSERAERTIAARHIRVSDLGYARVARWNGDLHFSFPVAGTSYTRGTWDGRDRITRLAGGVRFSGAQSETWRALRVNERTNRVTALVDGVRRPVLRFGERSGCGGFSGRYSSGSYGATPLRLTRAGQASLDRAAGANVFWAGEVFAWAGH